MCGGILNLECKTRRTDLDQPQWEVANVGLIVHLDVALPTIGHLELPLNDNVGALQFMWIGFLFVRLHGTEP